MRVDNTYDTWSEAEIDQLKEGVRKFGKDFEKIANFIQTKDYNQVNARIYQNLELYPEVKMMRSGQWAEIETRAFVKLVEKVGMNTTMLQTAFPNRGNPFRSVHRYTKHLRKQIENDPKHKYAHLYDSLFYDKGAWTPEEDETMLECLKGLPNRLISYRNLTEY